MSEQHSVSLQPGTVIGGKYEVVKCLGSGSMGLVYACRHRELQGQIVAVKVLFPEVAEDKVASARFKNEILASYKVSHPNVVRAYDYLTDRDLVAYTMEYVGGGDLAEKLSDRERMAIPEIVRLLSQMAAGCQAIHEAGIVHRDLKPENILLTNDGNVKIADFGIARNRHGPKLTEHGGVVGTIDYVAPEYMLKSQVDWRSDIYALGILAYEMVTGEAPFQGDSVYATMTKRLKTDPEPPSKLRSECPAELDRVILKAMARDPESRYQSSMEMFVDLQKIGAEIGLAASPSSAAMISTTMGKERASSQPVVSLDPEGGEFLKEPGSSRRTTPPTVGRGAPLQGGISSAGAGGGAPVWGSTPGSSSVMDPSMAGFSGDVGGVGGVESAADLFGPSGSRRSDTDIQSISASGPPVVGSAGDVVSESWTPVAKGVATSRRKELGTTRSLPQAESRESYTVDIFVFGFAAAVGIAFGFLFLRMFAPALLAQWHL